MMWMIILILTLVASFAGIIYLAGKAQMFLTRIKKMSTMKKIYQKLTAFACVLFLLLVITIIADFINALICILHLLIISLICDLVGWLIKIKNRKAVFLTAVGVAIVYLGIGFYLVHHVWVTDYTITIPAKPDITEAVNITKSNQNM